MDCSIYRELLEAQGDMERDEINKYLKIYLQAPSLPTLRAVRVSLVELKEALAHQNASTAFYPKLVRQLLCKRRLGNRAHKLLL